MKGDRFDLSPFLLNQIMRIERLSSPRLVGELALLLNQEWGELSPWAAVPEIESRLAAQLHSQSVPFTLLALGEQDVLVGSASVKLFEIPERLEMYWLGEVIVRPEARGQGIGSALIRACVAECQRFGLPELHLYTPNQQALYARMGWDELEQAVVNGEKVSIMRLRLK